MPKIRVKFVWQDFWLGLFYDNQKRKLYICLLPMFPIIVEFGNKLNPAPRDERAYYIYLFMHRLTKLWMHYPALHFSQLFENMVGCSKHSCIWHISDSKLGECIDLWLERLSKK